MELDNTTLQVLANYCAAATESMGYTLMRTAYSTFVKETEDFSCQLMTASGLTVASPRTFGATWYTGLDYGEIVGLFDYREGDVCITSDPYAGNVATHTPDVHLWAPVFRDGRLVCFVGCHVHNTDVGGAVPATLSRVLTEIQQEGLRIPPMRLVRDGKLNDDLLAMISRNVRLPDQNWGDLNAQLACLSVGQRKVQEIVDRFGTETFVAGLDRLLDYAESQSRALIAGLPDGEYSFADYADEDSEGGYPMRIAITLKIKGDTIELDFSDSDPQLASSLNVPTGGKERHALAMVGVIYVLYSLDPSLTLNYGLLRPIRAIMPRGSVMHAVEPAAVGMRSLTCIVAQAATFGAFAQAVPDRLPASPGNSVTLMNVKTSTRSGQSVMASIGPVSGGSGAGKTADGTEGCGGNMSFLKNTPVEVIETEIPIEMRRYGLVRDSGGAGRCRGGTALEMEFRLSAPQSMVTARNRDRCVFTAWGLAGGSAGGASFFTRNPDTPEAQELGSLDVVGCDPGDVLRVVGPGGGGYGNPFERPIEAVLSDVRRELVSIEAARELYGVVIGQDLVIDEVATSERRAANDATGLLYGHGPGRQAYERIWTAERYAVLIAILGNMPISWRFFVKHRIFKMVADEADTSGGAAQVLEAYRALTKQFVELPPYEHDPEVLAA